MILRKHSLIFLLICFDSAFSFFFPSPRKLYSFNVVPSHSSHSSQSSYSSHSRLYMSVVGDENLVNKDNRKIRKHPKVPEEIYTDYIPSNLLEEEERWEGYQEGFDWQLEQARRLLEGPGFAPLRMTLWQPPTSIKRKSLDGSPVTPQPNFWDHSKILLNNALQMFGLAESLDGAPVVQGVNTFRGSFFQLIARIIDGNLAELAGGPLFLLLQKYYQKYGSVYKLAFGPKSFIVISDPVLVKHILKDNPLKYDKGILAEILDPIMGKGLIPADPDTWKVRRRAIVPGFHKAWLNAMMSLFVKCNQPLIAKLTEAAETGKVLDMETEFCSVALDIIGRAVFNYDFGSVTKESPVVKAVYRALQEAEHRSISFIPYWNLPFANHYFPSLKQFAKNMNLLNSVLNELIQKALSTQSQSDIEELERRDYSQAENASLLRFLVDMRGENTTSKQLRDDLMTLLIGGHETTAAMLTWTFFELSKNPKLYQQVQAEIDEKLQGKPPTFEDTLRLPLLRLCLAETLRMYPEPPLLIRRALEDDRLPAGIHLGKEVFIPKGTDLFISTFNIHRSEEFWDQPNQYNPFRFLSNYSHVRKDEISSYYPWNGFKVGNYQMQLYPNEVNSDFAFLPFGGGIRKCVGDQFAMMESVATVALILQRFDVELAVPEEQVGMKTGATIHTANGLMMRIKPRQMPFVSLEPVQGGKGKVDESDDLLSHCRPQTSSSSSTAEGSSKCPF